MFRDNPAHAGVSAETAISSTTAGTLAAGWTASLGTTSYTSPAVATSAALGQALVYAAGTSTLHAYRASTGAPVWSFGTGKAAGARSTPRPRSPAGWSTSAYGRHGLRAERVDRRAAVRLPHRAPHPGLPVVENAPDGSGPWSTSAPTRLPGRAPSTPSTAPATSTAPAPSAGSSPRGGRPGRHLVPAGVRQRRQGPPVAGVRQRGPRRLGVRPERQHRGRRLAAPGGHRIQRRRGRRPTISAPGRNGVAAGSSTRPTRTRWSTPSA